MSYRGGATFAWQSDYAQFYLVDVVDNQFEAPTDVTPDITTQRCHPMTAGLVILTNDCLQQLIEVRIFGDEPSADTAEWRSGRAWTQVETVVVTFPSKQFTLDSPSKGSPGRYGPNFRVDATTMSVRVQWMEFQDSRDDTKLTEPDVIRLDLWPFQLKG
jgi:hypothetical protein